MKHFNTISKILLIVVALVGLTIGMSTITGCSNSSNDTKATVSDKVDDANAAVKETKCGEGTTNEAKCGGDDAKTAVSDAKENVEEAKCGEGKCG